MSRSSSQPAHGADAGPLDVALTAGSAVTAFAAPPAPGASAASSAGHTSAAPADAVQGDHVAVLLLARISASARLWGWSRIVRGAGPWLREPGALFAKAMGSGHEGGFGLRPSASHQGLFMVFDGEAAAARFAATSPQVQAYRERTDELAIFQLRAWSARGRWSGQGLAVTGAAPPPGTPVASLTRASIRPGKATRFWPMAPAAQQSLASAPGCRLAVGLGEAPVLRQCTFSLWDSVAAMDAYARSGAHLAAIKAAHQGAFFSESMFVRFVPLQMQGRWQGRELG